MNSANYWEIRQDGGFEAVGAYGQSVPIYPNEHLVIAVNSGSVDHHGRFDCRDTGSGEVMSRGDLARWRKWGRV